MKLIEKFEFQPGMILENKRGKRRQIVDVLDDDDIVYMPLYGKDPRRMVCSWDTMTRWGENVVRRGGVL